MTSATDTELVETAAGLRLAVTRTARRLRQEGAGELGPSAASALSTLERHGPLTPSELADLEQIKRPSATRILRGMVEDGLVERTPDPSDGRSALITITAAGRERLRRLRKRKNAYLARRLRSLDAAEVAVLERAAEILEQVLDADRPDAGRAREERA